MLNFTVSLICGIAAFYFFPFFPFSVIVLGTAACVFISLMLRRNKKRLFLIILIFISGYLYSFTRYEKFPEIKLPDREIIVEGTVIDIPEVTEEINISKLDTKKHEHYLPSLPLTNTSGEGMRERVRFTIDNVYIEKRSINGKIKLSASPEIFFKDISYGPAYGDRIRVYTKLREPSSFHNPGIYSYDFKKDGIVAAGYVKQLQVINEGSGLLAWIYKKRQIIGKIIDNSLSAENASFHKAIIIGLQRGISDEIRDAFSATGLAHLLSISGSHFGLLAFILFTLMKTITNFLPMRMLTKMTLYVTPTQIAVILTMPVLVLYALISGASTPTIRSMIMIFIYMLALFIGRKGQWLNSLSIAAIIILLYQPNTLFELSFQLSFIAVLSIGYVFEHKEHRIQNKDKSRLFNKLFEKIKISLLLTTAAVLGTAPIVALVFKQFPLISPVANLVVTPFVCFIILPLSLFASFIALLFNMTIMPLSGLLDSMTQFTVNLIMVFSYIPYSNLYVHTPSFIMMLLYYLSFMLIMKTSSQQIITDEYENLSPPNPNVAKGGRGALWIKNKDKLRFLPLVLVISFYLINPYLSGANNFRLTFLDVGQGDSSVVELPDKRVMLIDGGTREPDTGRRVIAPYLWSKGIKKIDYIVLSHPHPDHYGGLIYIMDNFKVNEVWLNWTVQYGAKEFLQKLQINGIPYKVMRRGDVLDAPNYKIYVFHPYKEFYADSLRGEFSNANSESIVLKIESDNVSALFTGDIEAETEEDLIHLGTWLKSDIIKVPHHGGKTSSSEGLLRTVQPVIAVVSAGKNNAFNHPHEETLERYKNAGARLFRTDMDGAVTIKLSETPFEIKTYQDFSFLKVADMGDELRNLKLLF